jgi:hypothetical protein
MFMIQLMTCGIGGTCASVPVKVADVPYGAGNLVTDSKDVYWASPYLTGVYRSTTIPTTVASMQLVAGHVALDSTHVYFTTQSEVLRIAK